ncbi:hypothetical protein ZIOFF_062374 [Zingiber officinale]|uniref:Uncharacterized protein n=1 Tax=Zingiber officinale TaxID=94328 RepID=A0A8J5F106_ZINOF|nr:hypothetical protein ZIOFF_062374 [Zingiber officinale]
MSRRGRYLSVIVITTVILGWITIKITYKPCIEQGHDAIDHAFNLNYNPDSAHKPSPAATNKPLLSDGQPAPSAPPTNMIIGPEKGTMIRVFCKIGFLVTIVWIYICFT